MASTVFATAKLLCIPVFNSRYQMYHRVSVSPAMLPGPVIGGRLVDAACVLWTPTGACSHYDIDQLRYNMYGMNIGCNSLATLVFVLALWKAWDMRSWPAEEHDKESEYFDKTENKPESDSLMGDFTFTETQK